MQDKSVVTLGRVMGKVMDEPYQNYIQNMFPNESDYHIILAVFELEKTDRWKCTYQDAELKIVGDDYMQYAYRKGSSRGGDITFTTKAGDLGKKFNTFLKQILNAIKTAEGLENIEEIQQFKALKQCVNENKIQIINGLEREMNNMNLKQQQKAGFSVRVMIDGEEKNIADFATFQYLLVNNGTEGKSVKYKVRSESVDKTCSICRRTKPLICLLYTSPSPRD